MCNYPKTIFTCNHVQVADRAVRPCQAQKDFLAGGAREPCDEIRSHPLSTVRQPFACGHCADRRAALDEKVDARAAKADTRPGTGTSEAAVRGNVGVSPEEADEEFGPVELDPVLEFLRKKMTADDAHLMMLGNHVG